ncbi:hypothetical protein H5410_054979 [Solanum commersonii]|uniref:Uncharacterized protein n=1 Tax=Solanum commersonii TaxID=4109 RepID=A0A9J5WHB5_SOLCO|nr:hypothetical protein H5410_054979 [Solanum commersonii]
MSNFATNNLENFNEQREGRVRNKRLILRVEFSIFLKRRFSKFTTIISSVSLNSRNFDIIFTEFKKFRHQLPGRPSKKYRDKAYIELYGKKNKNSCSICGFKGHNRGSCRNGPRIV